MMKAIGAELARNGSTANTILPGWIDTPTREGAFGNERSRTRSCPASRAAGGEPEGFGPGAAHLASPASRSTSQTFVIDGGYSIF